MFFLVSADDDLFDDGDNEQAELNSFPDVMDMHLLDSSIVPSITDNSFLFKKFLSLNNDVDLTKDLFFQLTLHKNKFLINQKNQNVK